MKRILLAMALVWALAVPWGCSPQVPEEPRLDPGDPALHVTMRNFFQADALEHVVGERFQAKLLQCAKIADRTVEGYPATSYYYHIVVAPTTELPIENIHVALFPETTTYFFWGKDHRNNSDPFVDYGPGWCDMISPMTKKEELVCLDFYTNWLTPDSNIENSSLTPEELDQGMGAISVYIRYNGSQEETLRLTVPALPHVTSAEDPLAQSDLVIADYFNDRPLGGRSKYFYYDMGKERDPRQ